MKCGVSTDKTDKTLPAGESAGLSAAFVLILLAACALSAVGAPPVSDGLVLHLDADAIEGLDDGDPVAQWDDESGEGNHASQADTGKQPTYRTYYFDGQPVVSFDGDLLTTPDMTIDGADLSVFVVSKGNHLSVFEDDFEDWEGWFTYGDGNVYQSSDRARTGSYSLIKDDNDDPDGGFKDTGYTFTNEYVFEGWIYRPEPWSSGQADRLAVSDEDANGYGFRWDTSNLFIERRDEGSATTLSSKSSGLRPTNRWYGFRFEAFGDGTFKIEMFDEYGNLLDSLAHTTPDLTHTTFSRVYVHGGHEYYVDDINLEVPAVGKILSHQGGLILDDSDDFETWEGWQNYRSGTVEQSADQARTGTYSLLKDNNSDPHGGYKNLTMTTDNAYVFEGWIFRPESWSGGEADRLAVSDEDANGYGFRWDTGNLLIERRDEGSATTLSSKSSGLRPTNQWYRFRFEAFGDGAFKIEMFDGGGDLIDSLTHTTPDLTYTTFSRVYIHGGHEYYVDDINITGPSGDYSYCYRYKGNQLQAFVNVDGELEGVYGSAGNFNLNSFISNITAGNLYIDGIEVDTRTYSASPASGTGPLDVGGLSFDGDIAEILIYDRALTGEQRQNVEQYLGGKWWGQVPGQPGTPTYTDVSFFSLTVNWTAPAEGGEAGFYRIERAPDEGGASGTFAEIATTSDLFYNDKDLESNTTYWYRVRAVNPGGDGPYSEESCVVTKEAPELPVIEGLLLCLDATTLELNDGEPVDEWPDRSAYANHAVQPTPANQPIYKTDITNGLPVVRFDGNSKTLFGDGLGITGSQGSTAFIVVRRNSMAQSTNTGVFSYGSASGDGGTVRRYSIDSAGLGVRFNNGNRIFSDPTNTNDFFVLAYHHEDGAAYGEHKLSVNTEEQSQESSSSPANITGILDDEYIVGAGRDGNGNIPIGDYFSGDIAEIIVYDQQLSGAEQNEIAQHLGEKWLGWAPLIEPAHHITLTGPPQVTAGEISGPFNITVRDRSGAKTVVGEETVFTLDCGSGAGIFSSDAAGDELIEEISVMAGEGTAQFYYCNTQSGSPEITVRWKE